MQNYQYNDQEQFYDILIIGYKTLQYSNQLNILKLLTHDYEKFEHALECPLINGRNVTKKFRENYDQPCAFVIYDKNIESVDQIDFDRSNIPNLYWLEPKCHTIVFSRQGYDMLLREHYIFLSRDWADTYPNLIFYVKNSDVSRNIYEPFDQLFEQPKSDDTYIDRGLKPDEDTDTELELSECNDKVIMCGCNDSYFEMQLNELLCDTDKKRYIERFNKYKKNRDELISAFNSYCHGKIEISDLAVQFKTLA